MRIIWVYILLLVTLVKVGAQESIYTEGTGVQALVANGSYQAQDQEINLPNHLSISPRTVIELGVSPIAKLPVGDHPVTVDFTVTPIQSDGSQGTTYASSLTVNHFSKIDIAQHEVLNSYGAQVQITNITNSTSLSEYYFQVTFEAERYYLVSNQYPTITSSPTATGIQLSWNPILGAITYQLEWTWVDSYDDPSLEDANDVNKITAINQKPAQDIPFSRRDFELNNTRVEVIAQSSTAANTYEIPQLYSQGYILYRVRAVGRHLNPDTKDYNYYGPWSSDIQEPINISNWDHHVITTPHQNEKNWQFQASYAEGGKKKEVVSYFDGSLRNRQTVTKINTDNHVIVGEVIYDAQGRPAIEVLPTPVVGDQIDYYPQNNQNTAGTPVPYSHKDFDWEDKTPVDPAQCDEQILGMNTNSGASHYYSPNSNAALTSIHKDHIPDAEEYPFSQIEYTPDNTGRIRRKSGVGPTHQLGTGHEMKYYYGIPDQPTLNRLFGYEVGYKEHYKKNLVVDPNGQVSVSYLDPQGRTIATALAGGNPEVKDNEGTPENPVEALDAVANGDHQDIIVDLLDGSNPNASINALSSTHNFASYLDQRHLSQQLLVAGTNVAHTFAYALNPVVGSDLHYSPVATSNHQYAFVYDLSLSLKDECGNEWFNPQLGSDLDPVQTPFQVGTLAIGNGSLASSIPTIDPTYIMSLNTGNYALEKKLTINQEVLKGYVEDYKASLVDVNNPNHIKEELFIPDYSEVDCNMNCAECYESIETQNAYVLRELKAYYNIASDDDQTIGSNYQLDPGLSAAIIERTTQAPVTQVDVSRQVYFLQRQWTSLEVLCSQLCGPSLVTNCQNREQQLLGDVSPGGQYGNFHIIKADASGVESELLDTPDPVSVYNNDTWRTPVTPYQDAYGVTSYIEVSIKTTTDDNQVTTITYDPDLDENLKDANGVVTSDAISEGLVVEIDAENLKIKPEALASVEQFTRVFWQDSWAYSLVEYHPEHCYLEYIQAQCQLTRTITLNGINKLDDGTTEEYIFDEPRTIDSDQYDAYLNSLETYADAVSANIFSLSGSTSTQNAILLGDPYFSGAIGGVVNEDGALFDLRKGIMEEAIATQYEDNILNQTSGANDGANLYEMAVLMTKCNSIQYCDYDNMWVSGLTPEEQNKVWQQYRSNYLSLKGRIQYTFMNLYATQNGCNNNCIGESQTGYASNVIRHYTAYGALTGAFSNANGVGQYCNQAGSEAYGIKTKIFEPIDGHHDSAIAAEEMIKDQVKYADYEYYIETGNCPQLQDLQVFLTGVFTDPSLIGGSGLQTISDFTGHYVTLDFLKANNTDLSLDPEVDFPFPASEQLDIVPTIGASPQDLSLALQADTGTYTPITVAIKNTGTLNYAWANYGDGTGNTWRIIDFKQFYFNTDPILSDPSDHEYVYDVVAVIEETVGGQLKTTEVLMQGMTRAPIGSCGLEGENPLGETLYANAGTVEGAGASCSIKYQFRRAMVGLLNQLHDNSTLNSVTPVDLDGYSGYKNSYLGRFFNENVAQTLTTTWVKDVNGYHIVKGGITLASFELDIPANATYFEGLYIDEGDTSDAISLYYFDGTDKQQATGQINPGLNYSCCDANDSFVPNIMLRRQINYASASNLLYVQTTLFKPLGVSFERGEEVRFDFRIKKAADVNEDLEYINFPGGGNDFGLNGTNPDYLFSWRQSDYAGTELKINDIIYSFNQGNLDFDPHDYGYTYSAYQKHDYPHNTFSWWKYWATQYDVYEFEYSIDYLNTSNIFSDNQIYTGKLQFNGTNNDPTMLLQNDLLNQNQTTFTSLNPNQPNVSQQFKLDSDPPYLHRDTGNVDIYGRSDQADLSWIHAHEFNLDHQIDFQLKGKLSFDQPLPYTYPSGEEHFGSMLQIDYEHANNSAIMDQIYMYATSQPQYECQPCVPLTVAPVACDEKYQDYLDFLDFDGPQGAPNTPPEAWTTVPRYSARIQHLGEDEIYDRDRFCASNSQYLVDSYKTYIEMLEALPNATLPLSVDHPYFLTLLEFGYTDLNYGYDDILTVIQSYGNYLSNAKPATHEFYYNWIDYVNKVYLDGSVECLPKPLNTYSIPLNDPNTPGSDLEDSCENMIQNLTNVYQSENVKDYISQLSEDFEKNYIDAAMAAVKETFTKTYADKEYQYTLYYYDQAGNLIQTVAPQGVNRLPIYNADSQLSQDIDEERARTVDQLQENPNHKPDHGFKTQYKYNSLNQLVWQHTPDGGITRFAYDELGRIIASQNAKQLLNNTFSYTKYDALGRITEAGQVQTTANYSINPLGQLKQAGNRIPLEGFQLDLEKTEVTKTQYTTPVAEATTIFETLSSLEESKHTSRNRVTAIYYYEVCTPDTAPDDYQHAIYYHYDIHGNVKEMVTDNQLLKELSAHPDSGMKKVQYHYDLISGNVNQVIYQKDQTDQFIHRYHYDADNRITSVQTSSDGHIWEQDAKYQYYAHGPLARTVLGQKEVQGLDYVYTLQGWLKGVNGQTLDATHDVNQDGQANNSSNTTSRDAFGYSLDYYQGDYKAIGQTNLNSQNRTPFDFDATTTIGSQANNLYNGNIGQMLTTIDNHKDGVDAASFSQVNQYKYDQLNRIHSMQGYDKATGNTNYGASYTYDKNGNLKTLNRSTLGGTPMDALSYKYENADANGENYTNNRLNHVIDGVANGVSDKDIDSQALNNYHYDEIGQLTQDLKEGIDKIHWRVDGKVKQIDKSNQQSIVFHYDGLGNRVAKTILPDNETTIYSRDAQGNVLAVYSAESNGVIQTSTTNIPDHRTVSEVITNGQVRSIKAVETLDTAPPAEVQSGGQLTFTAGNHIHFTDGFVAQPGSDFKAQILPVQSTGGSQASIVSGDIHLKEHHIYGSSRIGIEQKSLLVYDSDGVVPPVVDNRPAPVNPLAPVAAVVDYSVQVNSGESSWSSQNIGNTGILPTDFDDMTFDTKITLEDASQLVEGSTMKVGDFYSQGITEKEILNPIDLMEAAYFGASDPARRYISEGSTAGDYNYTIASAINGYEDQVNVLASNQDGYMQFNAGCLFFDGNQFISGFRFGDMGYFFVGSRSSGVYTYILRIHNYTTNSFSDSLPILGLDLVNHKLRVSRTADQVTLSVHQLNDEPITTTLHYGGFGNPAHHGGILATYNLASASSLGTVVVNLQIAGQGFYDLQVARNELAPVELTNHFELKLEKVASTGIRPIYNFNRYEKVVSTGKTESYNQQIIGSNNLSDQTIETDGLEVTFSATFNNLVKNTDTSIQSPVNANNTLGAVGQNITYDLCYLNYNLSNVTGQAQAYNFDTTTSTDTPPPLLSNRQFGPCLFDQDKDGIYDLYEDLDNDQNLSNDDTDFDGVPNYLDPDDDGDGIFTKYEGVSKPTPNKYLNPHNQVGLLQNTNDPTTGDPSNPYHVTNTIPDYLDNDDDGDGYKTWETTEGGPGVASYTIDLTTNPAPVEPFNGQPYTQNTDNNGAVDYLEYTDIVYQEQLPLVQHDYQNTMGDKRYELSNHLGNVLAVITDLKLPSSDLTYFKPDVLAYNDYYPFGMLVDGNKYEGDDYRYGFNGMEKDDEVKGEGDSYTSYWRSYDPRVGRWLSLDPLMENYPSQSPYASFDNSPVKLSDPHGNCSTCKKPDEDGTEEGQMATTTGQSNMGQTPMKVWFWHGGTDYTEKGWYSEGDYEYTQLDYENGQVLLPREEKSFLMTLLTGKHKPRIIDIKNNKVVELQAGEVIIGIPVNEDGYIVGELAFQVSKEAIALELPWYLGNPSKKAGAIFASKNGFKLGANFLFNSRGLAKAYLKRIILKLPKGQKPLKQWTVGADKTKRGLPNYVYSESVADHGKFWLYKTNDGYKVMVNHIKDGKNHFHIGIPKDPNSVGIGADAAAKYFQTTRYKKIEEVSHAWFK